MAFTHRMSDADLHQHDTVDEARECEDSYAEFRTEYDAEMAFERHLETRDWAEQAAFEDYERRMGKVSFEDAYAAAMAAPTA